MQPAIKSHVVLLCLAALLGAASGVTVEGVHLVNNQPYIDYGLGASANYSLLECVYHREEGEEVYRVFWEMWDDSDKLGTYEWRPGSGGNATGRLEGVVELNRDDGSLELTKLGYDLGGRYSCGVSLTNGITKDSLRVEVLIVDINGDSTFKSYDHGCVYANSYQSPTVFPEPTLHAGMFSPKLNKYYKEISSQEWRRVIHPNGSVTSYYNYAEFVIDRNAPDDVIFKFMMDIFKADGDYIPLDDFTTSDPSWNELGCPDVREEVSKKLDFYPWNSLTCRGERKNMTKVTQYCAPGYEDRRNVYLVKRECNGTSLTWEPDQNFTANFEDLVCVPRPIVRLVNNLTYIDYRLGASANNSLLECVGNLDEGEEVHRVFWKLWDDDNITGTYEWRPGSGGNATGKLEGVVELNRDDGSLELTKLRYNLGGMYSCHVSLTDGFTKNSTKEEVLIIDVEGGHWIDINDHRCYSDSSYQSPAVFPEPTLHAGLFSPKLNIFYREVYPSQWSRNIHPNGSVTYFYNNISFLIQWSYPDDIVFKVTMGIYNSNNEYIPLGASSYFQPSWHEHGCPDLWDAYKNVDYSPQDSTACLGGRRSMTKATVTCRYGYQAEGNVSVVTMRCNGTSLTWEPEQGQTATIENLVCVRDTVTTTENPGGGVSRGNPSLVLLLASLLGVVARLFPFSHP